MITPNIILIILGGIVAIWIFFADEIASLWRKMRESLRFTFAPMERRPHVPSVSNLPPPSHVLSHNNPTEATVSEDFSEDDEPDEDDLRIARNNRMAKRLKPFDRVLIRDEETDNWEPAFFAYYDESDDPYPFYCTNNDHFAECIPYEGNEHMYMTNDDYDYGKDH